MNDFEAPQLKDTAAPRIFNTIRAGDVEYNMDFVLYLFNEEIKRRESKNVLPMTEEQARKFIRDLTTLVIIHANVEAAIQLRPESSESRTITQLNG